MIYVTEQNCITKEEFGLWNLLRWLLNNRHNSFLYFVLLLNDKTERLNFSLFSWDYLHKTYTRLGPPALPYGEGRVRLSTYRWYLIAGASRGLIFGGITTDKMPMLL